MIEIKIDGETVTSKVIPRNPEELRDDLDVTIDEYGEVQHGS